MFRVVNVSSWPNAQQPLRISLSTPIDTARAAASRKRLWLEIQAWGRRISSRSAPGISTSPPVQGALQKRREIVPGRAMIGYECSFRSPMWTVAAAVKVNGGTIVMPKAAIPGVGKLIFFKDTRETRRGDPVRCSAQKRRPLAIACRSGVTVRCRNRDWRERLNSATDQSTFPPDSTIPTHPSPRGGFQRAAWLQPPRLRWFHQNLQPRQQKLFTQRESHRRSPAPPARRCAADRERERALGTACEARRRCIRWGNFRRVFPPER